MTSLRKFSVCLTTLACAGLLGCGSSNDNGVTPALPPASVSASPNGDAAVPPTPSGAAPGGTSAPAVPPIPGNPTGAVGQPGSPTAAPNPAAPNPAAPNPGAQNQPGQPNNPATLPSLANDPAKALADSGKKGQDYLKALQAGGIPSNPKLDGIYILFAQATCQAEQKGNSRDSILQQFDQIGSQLAGGTGKSARQISELFVTAAEQNMC